MVSLSVLWLPIVLSAVMVFVASWILHMAPLWHRSDYPRLAEEDRFMGAVRPLAIPPGDYMVPRGSMKEMRSPEFIEKCNQGPVMVLTVMPNGMRSIGRSLGQWFVFVLIIGLFVAYVTSRALPAGTVYLRVFQIAGATAFIAYGVSLWQMSIWYGRGWSNALKETVDGVIYALLTAGTFAWLWPH
jgi:hypothetical protein